MSEREIELSTGAPDAAPPEFTKPCPACGHLNPMRREICEACEVVMHKARLESRAHLRNMGDARTSHAPERRGVARLLIGAVVLLALAAGAWFFLMRPSYAVVGPPVGKGGRTVILLHGFGAPGDALVARAQTLSETLPDTTWVMPAGPHGARTGRAWVTGPGDAQARESAEESRQAIAALLRDIAAKGVDPATIYLGGYSQGAQLAFDFALTPDQPRFGGLILLSSGLPTWPGARTLGDSTLPEGVEVFLAHGEKDPIVGIEQAARMRAQMFESGVKVSFHTAPGGHAVDDETLAALAAWLAR